MLGPDFLRSIASQRRLTANLGKRRIMMENRGIEEIMNRCKIN
jgi:hypothetical protein